MLEFLVPSARLGGEDRPVAVVLIAHFQDCLNELQQIVENDQFNNTVTVILADQLQSDSIGQTPVDESQCVDIVVGERHPLESHDQSIVKFANSLGCRCRISHHLSLDDPLIKPFISDWWKPFLKRLGVKDGEPVRHKMITDRIKTNQARAQLYATGDAPAASGEQWIELNVPANGREAMKHFEHDAAPAV